MSPLTTFILNENAPNRLYIDGDTVYCTQSNANPTTKIEDCTTTSGSPLTVHQGDAITADPILPPTRDGDHRPESARRDRRHAARRYPGAPAARPSCCTPRRSSRTSSSARPTAGRAARRIHSRNGEAAAARSDDHLHALGAPERAAARQRLLQNLPRHRTSDQPIQEVTCTGFTPATQSGVPAGSSTCTGCSGGTGSVAEGNWIGGPNAAIAPFSTLEQIGEGKNSTSKGPQKLFGNNEDLPVLRAAYTDNGINFTDLGAISGSTSGTRQRHRRVQRRLQPLPADEPVEHQPDEPRARAKHRHHRAALRRLARHDHHEPRRQLRHVPVRRLGHRR